MDWVYQSFWIFVALFDKFEFKTNTDKTKSVVFTPGFMWVGQDDAAYHRKMAS